MEQNINEGLGSGAIWIYICYFLIIVAIVVFIRLYLRLMKYLKLKIMQLENQ
ncbi:hypothetical protein [uncultured Psychroserpens sp.]|uniref:hypothetical protein n=1 Tax=uncultured Psychroserpens sp. TaxID=255436 RepID=UPI002636B9B8|nr:hypothetical protein [uncultured Psychroserpens sp.]